MTQNWLFSKEVHLKNLPIIIIIFIFFINSNLFSTDSLSTVWTWGSWSTNNLSRFYCVREDYEGNIIAGGYQVISSSDEDGYIVKLNGDGNFIWAKYLSDFTTLDRVNDVLPLPDGNYVLTGKFKNKFFLRKINCDGDSVWMKVYDYFNTSGGQCIALNNIGGYVVVGSMNGGCIIYTDSVGDVLWDKIIGNTNILNTVCRLNNGNYLIGGDTIIIIDESGSIIWQSGYISDDCIVTDAFENISGDYVFACHLTVSNAGMFFCVNAQDSLIWSRVLAVGGFDVIGGIKGNENKEYYIAGEIHMMNGYIFKLDSLGNVVWQVRHGGNWDGTCYYSINPCINGDYILCGFGWSWGPNYWAFIRQVRNIVTCVEEVNTDYNNEISFSYSQKGYLFNFSTSEPVNLEMNIFDINGRLLPYSINRYFNPGSYEINLDIEIPGQYFYFIKSDKFEKSGKFIVFE